VLVTVVPMFAPIIIGTAFLMFSVPAAISPTMVDVVKDEDWTTAVERSPTANPTMGLAVFWIKASATPFPMRKKALDISSMLKKKK